MSDIDLTTVEATILDYFNPPDRQHASWWINTENMAKAVYPVIEKIVREQIAQELESVRNEVWQDTGPYATDVGNALSRAARIARGGAR